MEITIEQKWEIKGNPHMEILVEHRRELMNRGRECIKQGLELNMFTGFLSEMLEVIIEENNIDYDKGDYVEYSGTWVMSNLP